jgi:hypothetical protein
LLTINLLRVVPRINPLTAQKNLKISAYSNELQLNGYKILKSEELKDFLSQNFATDINVGNKIRILTCGY